jgi:hypothetical protein
MSKYKIRKRNIRYCNNFLFRISTAYYYKKIKNSFYAYNNFNFFFCSFRSCICMHTIILIFFLHFSFIFFISTVCREQYDYCIMYYLIMYYLIIYYLIIYLNIRNLTRNNLKHKGNDKVKPCILLLITF